MSEERVKVTISTQNYIVITGERESADENGENLDISGLVQHVLTFFLHVRVLSRGPKKAILVSLFRKQTLPHDKSRLLFKFPTYLHSLRIYLLQLYTPVMTVIHFNALDPVN